REGSGRRKGCVERAPAFRGGRERIHPRAWVPRICPVAPRAGRRGTGGEQAPVQIRLRGLLQGAPVRSAHRGEPRGPVQAPHHPGGLCPPPRDDRSNPRRRGTSAGALTSPRRYFFVLSARLVGGARNDT